jgi:hypothetical protein
MRIKKNRGSSMSISQIIQIVERLSLKERLEIIEALYASIKRELQQGNLSRKGQKTEPFELMTFDLGQEVQADRDEIYAEREL